MKLTYWVNKGLKDEQCFEENFNNADLLNYMLSCIHGGDCLERCFWLGKGYNSEFEMHIYVLNKDELKRTLEYLDILTSQSHDKKLTGLWYTLNKELDRDDFKILIVAFEYE